MQKKNIRREKKIIVSEDLYIRKSALIVIDMQKDYIIEKKQYIYSPVLIDKINFKIQESVKGQEMIIYVQNKGRRKRQDYVSEFVERLLVVSDYIIEKEKASLFHNPNLLKLLKDNNTYLTCWY